MRTEEKDDSSNSTLASHVSFCILSPLNMVQPGSFTPHAPLYKRDMSSVLFLFPLLLFAVVFHSLEAQLDVCQANCESADRITGATRMKTTRPNPYKVAIFPSKVH